ncbi:putative reverse transcriptase domain-containing protein, partial [Tanacetum coccineum]
MEPKKRTTRLNPKTTTTTPAITSVTNAQLKAMIDQGVTTDMAVRDADKNTNGDDSHISGAGTEGVAGLFQWFEKMESVFHISNYIVENQVKFATCTLHSVALTWWNTHVKIVGHDVVYSMPWKTHMKMMTGKYCPRNEIKKLETDIWDLKVKEPTTTEHEAEHWQGTGEKKQYGGSKPLCSKCNYYHDGPCAPRWHKCNKVGHLARDYRSTTTANNANNQRGTGLGQKPTCYECGVQRHFKRECPKLKNNNNNRGNQVRGGNTPAKVYAVGHAGTNPDSNIVTGTFLLNNRYASILFDTGADRSFVSTSFSPQIDITPTALNHYYDVELADRRII